MNTDLTQFNPTIDTLIEGWLYEKRMVRSGSAKTDIAYRSTLNSFRATLKKGEMDIDSPDIATLVRVAGMWASIRVVGARLQGDVSSATYNQRLAILSSFYHYYQEQARLYDKEIVNPIPLVKKRKVQAYAGAIPIDGDEVVLLLEAIDQGTPQGQRDYVLLSVAFTTGRRGSELVNLRQRDIKVSSKKVTLTFHCKGGKIKRDTLDQDLSRVFLDYQHSIYGSLHNADAPVWVSLSRQNAGEAITIHTLYDICSSRLGVSKTHVLRHTFAVEMEKLHAPISEISDRLGHTDEKITGIYLKQVRSAENPYAGKLANRFGIGKER